MYLFIVLRGDCQPDFNRLLKMGRNFVFGCFSFFFVFHATSGTTNIHRAGLCDISDPSLYINDLNHPKKFSRVEKNWFEFFDFSSYFERIKRASRLTTA